MNNVFFNNGIELDHNIVAYGTSQHVFANNDQQCYYYGYSEQIHPKLIHGNTLEWVLSGISSLVRGRKTKSVVFVFLSKSITYK